MDVRQFQMTHTNHLGKPLSVDGISGPQTNWAFALSQHSELRQKVVARALSFVGTREEPMGSNRGFQIDRWLERCGIPVPKDDSSAPQNAWCAAFVSWCISVQGLPNRKRAAVRQLAGDMGEVKYEHAQPGDLGFFLRSNGTGHVWMVIGARNGWTMNVEGNTRNAVRVTQRPRARYLSLQPVTDIPDIIKGVPAAGLSTR